MRSSPRIRSPSSSLRRVSICAVRSPPAMRSVVSIASRIGCRIERDMRQVDSSSSATRPNIIPVTICTVVMRERATVVEKASTCAFCVCTKACWAPR